MDYEDKEIFYVSSADRVSGTSSDFTYKFDILNSTYDHVVVLAASIPKSYYLISTYNDEFTLTEGAQTTTIRIPVGNYGITAWKNVLMQQLNTTSPNNWIYAVTYNTIDGKLIFDVSGNGVTQPQFTFNEYLYEQMGFNTGTYTFVNNELTSVNVINLQLLNALFIHSDVCNNKHNGVLQEIYSNHSDYSNIDYQATSATSYAKEIAYNNGGTYRFYLTNTYGNIVDLNGLNWNFTLLFYKKNNTLDLIKKYIQYTLLQQ